MGLPRTYQDSYGCSECYDHGKCVGPDEKISLYTGENIGAKELYNRYKERGKVEKEAEEERRIDVRNQEIYVNSFDKKTGEVVKGKISKLWKLKKTDPLVKISLHNGSSVETTPEHKFLILERDGDFSYRRADEIKEGEVVVAARNLKYSPLSIEEMKGEILEKLSEESKFYVNLGKDLKEELHREVLEQGRKDVWERIDSPLKWKSFYHSVWRGQYRLRDLVRTAEIFDKDLANIYDSIRSLNFRGTSQRGVHSSVELSLPKTKEEFNKFFWLVGMFFGDGCCEGNISNINEELQEKISDICKEVLNVDVHIRRYEGKCPRIDLGAGKTFMNLLQILFDLPGKEKSRNISISKFLERCQKGLIASFIRGYFDADGTIEKARSAVSVSSASEEMLEGLQLLLYKFDVASKINWKKRALYISGGSSLENFKPIGFSVSEKKGKFENLWEKSSVSKLDLVPIRPSIVGLGGRKEISKSDLLNSQDSCLGQGQLKALSRRDSVFSKVDSIKKSDSEEYVYDFTVEDFHNFISEGIVIHNTTMTDNLLAGAGMISDELAGEQLFMDYDEQEQERGITIYSANVSMVHDFEGKDFLINLIDTPGHVDFGGDVTRAMRAVDGVIILICAVEGVMPQTETVVQQALKERVKPILFINKVDRLINELELDAKGMQEKFMKIITEVNNLIRKYAEDEYKKKWSVSVEDGSVMFGSALKNWAISLPYMKETGITFKDIQEHCSEGRHKEMWEKAPLHRVILNGIIRHLPDPTVAQEYRIPKIWPGDVESEIGEDMLGCNAEGKLAAITTKVYEDPHAGSVATGRIFSGRLEEGQEVHLVGQHKNERVQQVCIYKGQERIPMDEVPAGNIIGLVGVPDAFSGETLCDIGFKMQPFEEIKHVFEPVVTKAIEAKNTKDLPKVIQFLRKQEREDPTLKVEIDEETGEHLVSGLGELHIQAKIERGLKEKGIRVVSSKPIVVYRETVRRKSREIEGKSPNKHNKFYFEVEPLPDEVYKALAKGEIKEQTVKKKDSDLTKKLKELGLDGDDAEGVEMIKEKNIFTDVTKGIQYLNETIELVRDAVEEMIEEGPLAKEPCSKVIFRLTDAKLHEDAIHRGPAQVSPAVRSAIRNAILSSDATLLEPRQILRIETPQEEMGNAMNEVQNRRGEVINVDTEEGRAILIVNLPVAEMFGFEGELKSVTGGRGFYYLKDVIFDHLPDSLREKRIKEIRQRKGLGEEIPGPEF